MEQFDAILVMIERTFQNLPERGVQDRGLTTLDKTTSNGLKYTKKYAYTSVFFLIPYIFIPR